MEQSNINDELEAIKEKAIEVAKTIYDPEIPVNIWDLGLVYDIQVALSKEVLALMTLTAPNCPEAESLPNELQTKLREIPEIKDARVLLTFDPPWTKDMMSEDAKIILEMM
jgi:FeS assembly SUF system protein